MLKKSKKCIKCHVEKQLTMYTKRKISKDGYCNTCRECRNDKAKIYHKTKKGLFAVIYAHQRGHSKDRGHPMPNYTLDELRNKYINDEKFIMLYDNWVYGGYQRDDIPSVDRKNDSLPYTLDNIRMIRFRINYIKSHKDKKNGRLKCERMYRQVFQYTLDGEYLRDFVSGTEASKMLNINQSNISHNCIGKRKSAGGYIWSFKKF